MKHLSIASLFACSLLLVLLDIITPATGCHKSRPYTRPTSLGAVILGLSTQTKDVVAVGSTWAELAGTINISNSSALDGTILYGIEYKPTSDVEGPFKMVQASQAEGDNFTVRITNLQPNTAYFYRSYYEYKQQKVCGSLAKFQTKATE